MRACLAACLLLTACGGGPTATPDATPGRGIDASPADGAAHADGAPGAAGFGTLSGMCGVLHEAELIGATPELYNDTFTFASAYVDATDRPRLTPGGQVLMSTPNAGGSSGVSEAFAYEELARCEGATLLATETEIVYDGPGKITDLEVMIGTHKIGVSVTRAVAFPFGDPYTVDAATTLIGRKLSEIQESTAHVDPVDKWDKQILAVLAYDATASASVASAWASLSADVKASSLVIVTQTDGDDLFIYNNQTLR